MKQVNLTIVSQKQIADAVMEMRLAGDVSGITASGQFVNSLVEGLFLRRPISVCDYDENSLTLVYKIVGEGTKRLAAYPDGTVLDVLTGLGNGYDLSLSGDTPLLLGGGVGVPPLYHLCKTLIAEGKHPTVVLGFNRKTDVFYEEEKFNYYRHYKSNFTNYRISNKLYR